MTLTCEFMQGRELHALNTIILYTLLCIQSKANLYYAQNELTWDATKHEFIYFLRFKKRLTRCWKEHPTLNTTILNFTFN